MINWDFYRNLFPVAKNHTYFMTAGAGPIPSTVLDAIKDRYTQLSLHGGDIFQQNLAIVERCREKIAKLINADTDDIAFIPNVSFGMNALSSSLINKKSLLIPEEDFPSSMVSWRNSEYDIQFIKSAPDLQDNIISALNVHSKLVISSFVQYSSGYRIDIDQIKQALQVTDSDLVINGTQGIGVFPIDVKKSKIDALICACHKWLFCGEGIAFMYIKRDFFPQLKPSIVGWRSSPFAMQFNDEFRLHDSAKVFEIGWSNMTIFSGLEKALDMIFDIGVENIAKRVTDLMSYLVEGLQKINIPTFSNYDFKNRSGIILIGPFENLDFILASLHEKNIFVTKRGNGIRLALHFYNNEEDINVFLSAMKTLCKH